MADFFISGNIVDVNNNKIYQGTLNISSGRIESITKEETGNNNYILPGLIDAHIHIESSMLVPSEFARIASVHGTVATVSDPHEIANVLGTEGVEFMLDNGSQVPFKFYFGAPSCVPATTFETAGATVTAEDIRKLLKNPEIKYLSEMMNFPGVLFGFPEVIEKLNTAKELNKPIDGHAPGLMGEDARKYIEAGITTDHECFTLGEALNKINLGMKILIREGSAAKNLDTLHSIIDSHNDMVMLCSDDKHPDDLVKGHINQVIKMALDKGLDVFKVLRAATLNPSKHYNLDTGLLRQGDDADLIIIDNFEDFNVLKTYIRGVLVAEGGKPLIKPLIVQGINNFKANEKLPDDFRIPQNGTKIRVIEAINGEIITNEQIADAKIENGYAVSDIGNDILKIAVINRYCDDKPSLGFIKNFGLKSGAIASSIAHDSHNVIVVGTTDEEISKAANGVIRNKGGLAVSDGSELRVLPLSVAGLMTAEDGYTAASKYSELDKAAKILGSKLDAPFMTLSFMALLVIPALKLSDKGLFNGRTFSLCDLWI